MSATPRPMPAVLDFQVARWCIRFETEVDARSALKQLDAHDALVEALDYAMENIASRTCPCCDISGGHDVACIGVAALRQAGVLP